MSWVQLLTLCARNVCLEPGLLFAEQLSTIVYHATVDHGLLLPAQVPPSVVKVVQKVLGQQLLVLHPKILAFHALLEPGQQFSVLLQVKFA